MSSTSMFWLLSIVLLIASLYLGKIKGIVLYMVGIVLVLAYCHVDFRYASVAFGLNALLTLVSIYVGQWRGFALYTVGSLVLIALLIFQAATMNLS